jgi:hypothetical protein
MHRSVHSIVLATCSVLILVLLAGCDSRPSRNPDPRPDSNSGPVSNVDSSGDSSPDSSGSSRLILEPAGDALQLGPNVARDASKGDDLYKPHSNVDDQAAIALDAADIVQAASQGEFTPADMRGVYENGKHTTSSSVQSLARDQDLAQEFPTEARYFGTPRFLDAPLSDALNGTGAAADYSPAQRRQVVTAGLQRVMAYTMVRQMQIAEEKLRKGDPDPDDRSHNYIDRAWAFYTASAEGEQRPGSLAMTAAELERAYGRSGTIDQPLRAALVSMQDGAARRNLDEFLPARHTVEDRLHTIFILATAQQMAEGLRAAERGDVAGAAARQVQGLTEYTAIQPLIAERNPSADQTITTYFKLAPAELNSARLAAALDALNQASAALNLQAADQVSLADLQA